MSTDQKSNWLVMLEHCKERMTEIKKHQEVEPLCMDERIELKIELSWGGPGDGFKLYLDKRTRQPVEGYYYYTDWFSYEEESLNADEIDLVAEHFGIC